MLDTEVVPGARADDEMGVKWHGRWERRCSFGAPEKMNHLALPVPGVRGRRHAAGPRARRWLCPGSPLMSARPVAGSQLLPQPGFSGFSAHLLCFVYKMVCLVPVGEEVCGLFIIDSDVMVRK